MPRFAFISATFCLFALTCSLPADAQDLSPCAVAAIGDSLTDSRSQGGKYLDYLRQKSPASRFDNYGKGGEMVNQMRRRFARDLFGEPGQSKPKYTHVIIFGGVNDLYSDLTAGRTPAKVERDLSEMYRIANERGIKVVAIDVAPWGGFHRYFNASRAAATLELNRWILAQVQDGTVVASVDAYSLLSCGTPEMLCEDFNGPFRDGIHFNQAAHYKLGEALYQQVFKACR
jgi:lysophospholipase L1-like esterase